jgi:hypothetical protein
MLTDSFCERTNTGRLGLLSYDVLGWLSALMGLTYFDNQHCKHEFLLLGISVRRSCMIPRIVRKIPVRLVDLSITLCTNYRSVYT